MFDPLPIVRVNRLNTSSTSKIWFWENVWDWGSYTEHNYKGLCFIIYLKPFTLFDTGTAQTAELIFNFYAQYLKLPQQYLNISI